MGGRGGSSGLIAEPTGHRMSIQHFLDNLKRNNQEGMLKVLMDAHLEVKQPIFTHNGNALQLQEAVLENGDDRVSVRFYNQWEPTQITIPDKAIKQTIEVVSYHHGDVTAVRTLAEKKSKSLKNAASNYEEMLEQWKTLTKQRSISFR
ncbi:MAG: hypothetical protein J6B43_11160 [Lachnospiraceae bacterium]|nr:hypothetical protein [Lachnospiraceae bacterium]